MSSLGLISAIRSSMEVDTHKSSINPLAAKDLGAILESYRPWCRVFVRQSLFGAVGKRIDESDVIQSTWVDVLRKADQFRGSTEAEFFGWLKVCLQNNLKNAVREHTAAKRDVRREQSFAIEMDSATLH